MGGDSGSGTALRLRTERLEISVLTASDVDAFVAYRGDPGVARFQSWDVGYDATRALRLVGDQPASGLAAPGCWLQLGLHEQAGGRLVGDVGVRTADDQPGTYELGVTLAVAHQGRGLASEACRSVLRHLFEVAHAHRVTATCDVRNEASGRLLRRLGMRHEARLVDADRAKGEWTSLDTYAVLAREHSLACWTGTDRGSSVGPRDPSTPASQDRPVRSVSFLGVHTEAFDEMRHLYAHAFGAPLVHEAPGVAWFGLADGAELHLYAVSDTYHRFFGRAPVPGLLVESYPETERRLSEFGVEWLTEPDTADGRIWRHYRAPDGNVYEVMGPLPSTLRDLP